MPFLVHTAAISPKGQWVAFWVKWDILRRKCGNYDIVHIFYIDATQCSDIYAWKDSNLQRFPILLLSPPKMVPRCYRRADTTALCFCLQKLFLI